MGKILFIITKLELGGAQEIVLDLCRRSIAEKYEVVLVTNNEGILVKEAEEIEGLKIYFLPELQRKISPITDLKCLFAVKRIIGLEKPDIVHTHSSKAGILGRIAAYMSKVEVILHTIHGFGFNDLQNVFVKNFLTALEKHVSKYTDKLIAVSQSIIEKGLKEKIGKREKYHLIYNGIDISAFQDIKVDRDKKLSEIGLDTDKITVGMVACLKPQKAPQDFIKLADIICQKIPRSQFMLIGDGVLRDELEGSIKNLYLKNRIHILGWRRDIPELLNITDIFVLTSLWEGLPLTVLQAMAAKKPVVVNAVDGNIDIIRNGENGYLCETGDIEGMADKVIYLLSNKDKAEEIGMSGNRFVQKFERNKMIDENIELYNRIYKEKHKNT